MFKRCPYVSLFFMLLLWGCSGRKAGSAQKLAAGSNREPAAIKPVYHIAFARNKSFGSTSEHLIGVRGWGSVISDDKNRVYIPDYRTNAIHVFDATGRYITQMGGKGRGPGEYLYMSAFQITAEDLYISDSFLYKITAYSLEDLTYAHTILLNPEKWKEVKGLKNRRIGGDFFVTNGGKILMGFVPLFKPGLGYSNVDDYNKMNTVQFYWLNQEGNVTSNKILEQKRKKQVVINNWGSKGMTTFKFFGNPLHAMTKEGMIATAQSTQFKITIYSPEGRIKKVINFPFKKTSLKRTTLIKDYKNDFPGRLKAVKEMDLPDTWPALNKMFFDDKNRLWVAAIVPNLKVYKWFIFNIKGQLLARFTWPRDTIQNVNRGFMYTIEDNKQGIRNIIRYKIRWEKVKR